LSVEQLKIENKIFSIKDQLYQDLHKRFEISQIFANKTQEEKLLLEQSRHDILDVEELDPGQTPLINLLMNAQQELRIHPAKIQFEYQRNTG
jgi:hypothetical protein